VATEAFELDRELVERTRLRFAAEHGSVLCRRLVVDAVVQCTIGRVTLIDAPLNSLLIRDAGVTALHGARRPDDLRIRH
jgi:hypothetical protein